MVIAATHVSAILWRWTIVTVLIQPRDTKFKKKKKRKRKTRMNKKLAPARDVV
jgi:hypothetical protein